MLRKKSNEDGFSYIDVMCAIVILMVGILAMISALMANLVRSFESEKRIIAKQIALSTVESIITAKEIKTIGGDKNWFAMRNVMPSVPVNEINGIFLTGQNPVREELGDDGFTGTADDACAATGPCGTNNSAVLNGFTREIVITDIDDPDRPYPIYPIKQRRVEVTIRYFVGSLRGNQTASTIIADYEETK